MNDKVGVAVVPVTVTVDASGNITCSPNPVVVTTVNALITFTLTTSGYTFPVINAVVVSPASSQFPYPAQTVKPTVVNLIDLCTVAADFSYNISVTNTATGVTTTLDPVIRNGTRL